MAPAADSEVRAELARMIGLMIDEPSCLRLESSRDGGTTVFTVQLPSRELGKVIGRQGRTARALRALMAARGDYEGRRYALEIREA